MAMAGIQEIGIGLINNGKSAKYNEILSQAAKVVLRSNGQWAKTSMYSLTNTIISGVFSGWY